MRRVTSGKPPAPLPPTVPAPVSDVIMAALQPDPARRVATAQDLQHRESRRPSPRGCRPRTSRVAFASISSLASAPATRLLQEALHESGRRAHVGSRRSPAQPERARAPESAVAVSFSPTRGLRRTERADRGPTPPKAAPEVAPDRPPNEAGLEGASARRRRQASFPHHPRRVGRRGDSADADGLVRGDSPGHAVAG